MAQFNILRILRGSDRPLPTMEISDRMVEIEPAVTRLLGKLEKSGLIKRQKNPSDARSVLCTITVDGLALLARLDAPMARFEDEHLGSLEEHRLQELISSLAQILTPTT